jgi:hypothetical protein
MNSGIRWHWIKKVLGYQPRTEGISWDGLFGDGVWCHLWHHHVGMNILWVIKMVTHKKGPIHIVSQERGSWLEKAGWIWFDEVMNQDIIYGCKSNYKVRNKVRDHTRSIPPFHTSVPYLFEGSVPYLCSIPLIHTLWYIYIYKLYLTICNYIYIYIWTCAIWFYICTHMHERTYIHECLHARIRLLCPSPVIALASLCLQHLQLLPTLLCDGRDVLGCCQLAV